MFVFGSRHCLNEMHSRETQLVSFFLCVCVFPKIQFYDFTLK